MSKKFQHYSQERWSHTVNELLGRSRYGTPAGRCSSPFKVLRIRQLKEALYLRRGYVLPAVCQEAAVVKSIPGHQLKVFPDDAHLLQRTSTLARAYH